MSTLSVGDRAAAVRTAPTVAEVARQVVLFALGMVAYFGVRGLTEGSVAEAQRHAGGIIALERRLGIFWELDLQAMIVGHDALVALANWVYIWGHWPVIFVVLIWLLLRHPAEYYTIRNAFLISGAIGVVIFMVFPVAPPRLTDLAFVDTVTEQSYAYRVLQPPAFVNQYAAMPSLHFGWDLIVGLTLYRVARMRPLRGLGLLMPVAMFAAIVLTANHYLLDAVVGALVATLGLLAAFRLRESRPDVA